MNTTSVGRLALHSMQCLLVLWESWFPAFPTSKMTGFVKSAVLNATAHLRWLYSTLSDFQSLYFAKLPNSSGCENDVRFIFRPPSQLWAEAPFAVAVLICNLFFSHWITLLFCFLSCSDPLVDLPLGCHFKPHGRFWRACLDFLVRHFPMKRSTLRLPAASQLVLPSLLACLVEGQSIVWIPFGLAYCFQLLLLRCSSYYDIRTCAVWPHISGANSPRTSTHCHDPLSAGSEVLWEKRES